MTQEPGDVWYIVPIIVSPTLTEVKFDQSAWPPLVTHHEATVQLCSPPAEVWMSTKNGFENYAYISLNIRIILNDHEALRAYSLKNNNWIIIDDFSCF